MLTNKALSPECPATLDEAVANAKTADRRRHGTTAWASPCRSATTGDGYHWYPLYSADGGYAFAQNADGTYDLDDMGVGKEGSIAAGERLAQLVNDGIVKRLGHLRHRHARRSTAARPRTSSPVRGRSPSRPRPSATS